LMVIEPNLEYFEDLKIAENVLEMAELVGLEIVQQTNGSYTFGNRDINYWLIILRK